jgi:hypothetical protein
MGFPDLNEQPAVLKSEIDRENDERKQVRQHQAQNMPLQHLLIIFFASETRILVGMGIRFE